MEKQYEKKITWTIKNFSSLPSEEIYSEQFIVRGSRWRLVAYPKGCGKATNKCLSLFLDVADSESLPDGWRRHTKYRLTVVNQISEKLSEQIVLQNWFDNLTPDFGISQMLPLTQLLDRDSGFIMNGEVKLAAEVGVLEVIGKSDVVEETFLVDESMDIHGFQVLSSQVESVNSLFEKYPDIASKFRPKNSHLRTAYLNSLLSLTEILCQSPGELSIDDLIDVNRTLSYLRNAGFRLNWLEKKLKEAGETHLQEIKKGLEGLEAKLHRHECSGGVLRMILFCCRKFRECWTYLIS